MKTTIITAAIMALTTSAAMATPKPATNTNQNVNHNSASAVAGASANAAAIAAQQQAQLQGQAQGQNQTASANNANSVSNSVNNQIDFEAGVGGIAVGAAGCTNGMAVGIVGASLGYTFSDKECKIIAEAAMLANLGMIAEARSHLTHIGRINQTVRAQQAAQANIGSAMSVSQTLTYATCDLDTTTNVLTVRQADGFTFEQASADCLAAHGF
jgi:hypothetical protein